MKLKRDEGGYKSSMVYPWLTKMIHNVSFSEPSILIGDSNFNQQD